MVAHTIPNYALYGDQAQSHWKNSFDFEWIPERSRPYQWKIRPHKHDALIQILYLTHGSGTVLMDHERQEFQAPAILLIPAQTVHGFEFSEDTDGPVVTAGQQALESLLDTSAPELIALVRTPVTIALSEVSRHTDTLLPLFLAIEREAKAFSPGQPNAGIPLLAAICIQIGRWGHQGRTPANTKNRKSMQIEKFRALVNANFKNHWPVQAYANQLGLTAGQLTRLCKEVLGISSLEVIQARLVHEAQRELIYTITTIKQLSDRLGFTDETYFGRFFRKHTGVSPRDFRAQATQSLLPQNAIAKNGEPDEASL